MYPLGCLHTWGSSTWREPAKCCSTMCKANLSRKGAELVRYCCTTCGAAPPEESRVGRTSHYPHTGLWCRMSGVLMYRHTSLPTCIEGGVSRMLILRSAEQLHQSSSEGTQLKQQGTHAGLPVCSEWGMVECIRSCTTQSGSSYYSKVWLCMQEGLPHPKRGRSWWGIETRAGTQSSPAQNLL